MYLVMHLIELGASKVHFLCSSSLIANHIKCHQGMWHMGYRNCLRSNWTQLQKMNIITPLGVNKTVEWCNSFVLVPKVNGKVRLCLGLVRLNQALIIPIHRRPMLNDKLLKLNNVQYMSIIDASSGYHNLKLDEKSYLTSYTFLVIFSFTLKRIFNFLHI